MPVAAISDILVWAKISQYLGTYYNSRMRLLQGRDIDPYYPLLIRMQRRELEFMNTFNPSDENIDATANYVYGLIKYLAQAKVIAGQGGSGSIVNPSTGVASTIQDISLEFELGVTASPVTVNGVSVTLPSAGDSSIILPLANIMGGSLLLTIGGVPQPSIVTSNSTYTTISYTASQATITLGPSPDTVFQNGNTYILSGLQFVNT